MCTQPCSFNHFLKNALNFFFLYDCFETDVVVTLTIHENFVRYTRTAHTFEFNTNTAHNCSISVGLHIRKWWPHHSKLNFADRFLIYSQQHDEFWIFFKYLQFKLLIHSICKKTHNNFNKCLRKPIKILMNSLNCHQNVNNFIFRCKVIK